MKVKMNLGFWDKIYELPWNQGKIFTGEEMRENSLFYNFYPSRGNTPIIFIIIIVIVVVVIDIFIIIIKVVVF